MYYYRLPQITELFNNSGYSYGRLLIWIYSTSIKWIRQISGEAKPSQRSRQTSPRGEPKHHRSERTNQTDPKSRPKGEPVRQQTISLQRWSMSWSLESAGYVQWESKSSYKVHVESSTCVEKEKRLQHRKFPERDKGSTLHKTYSFSYHRDTRVHKTLSL